MHESNQIKSNQIKLNQIRQPLYMYVYGVFLDIHHNMCISTWDEASLLYRVQVFHKNKLTFISYTHQIKLWIVNSDLYAIYKIISLLHVNTVSTNKKENGGKQTNKRNWVTNYKNWGLHYVHCSGAFGLRDILMKESWLYMIKIKGEARKKHTERNIREKLYIREQEKR